MNIQTTHTKTMSGSVNNFTAGAIADFLSDVPQTAPVSIRFESGHQRDPDIIVMTVNLAARSGLR